MHSISSDNKCRDNNIENKQYNSNNFSCFYTKLVGDCIISKNTVSITGQKVFNNIYSEQYKEKKSRHHHKMCRISLIIDQHTKERIKAESYKCKIIYNQNFAQFMAVEPHQKLINQKENKHSL